MTDHLLKTHEAEALLARAMRELQRKTADHMAVWGLGDTERWDADLNAGLITFTNATQIVVGSIQVVGTFDSNDGTWLWGWDHPSVSERLSQDALLVRDFGERYALARYETSLINCTMDEAWQFTALACHLANAAGAYRGPAGTSFVFMTFHDIEIAQRQ